METKMQCKKCGNKEFELTVHWDCGLKTMIAHCKCGRVVEYTGDFEAVDITPQNIGEAETEEIDRQIREATW